MMQTSLLVCLVQVIELRQTFSNHGQGAGAEQSYVILSIKLRFRLDQSHFANADVRTRPGEVERILERIIERIIEKIVVKIEEKSEKDDKCFCVFNRFICVSCEVFRFLYL